MKKRYFFLVFMLLPFFLTGFTGCSQKNNRISEKTTENQFIADPSQTFPTSSISVSDTRCLEENCPPEYALNEEDTDLDSQAKVDDDTQLVNEQDDASNDVLVIAGEDDLPPESELANTNENQEITEETDSSEILYNCAQMESYDESTICREEEIQVEHKIPIYRNARVDAFIRLYSEKKRDLFQKGINRSAKYLKMIHRIFKEYNLPDELAYLAAVESNFNPVARSRARATGLWQFMSRTGRRYQLNQSWWHDERYDPERSTVAAAKYLKKLFQRFQSWELALAAYNSGGGTVRKAIARAKAKGKNTDFWSLRLPRETRGYVPAFMAVNILFKNLDAYGFTPPAIIDEEKDIKFVEIPGGLPLKKIAAVSNTDYETLSQYNPSLRRKMTPPNVETYSLRFPEQAEIDPIEIDQLAKTRVKFWKIHRVRSGESLWKISRMFGIPISKIKGFNGMGRSNFLRIGKRILLPIPEDTKYVRTASSRKHKKPTNFLPKISGNIYTFFHQVKKGESLWSISQLYDVSVKSILSWNHIRSPRRGLQIGVKIKIKVPIAQTAQTRNIAAL